MNSLIFLLVSIFSLKKVLSLAMSSSVRVMFLVDSVWLVDRVDNIPSSSLSLSSLFLFFGDSFSSFFEGGGGLATQVLLHGPKGHCGPLDRNWPHVLHLGRLARVHHMVVDELAILWLQVKHASSMELANFCCSDPDVPPNVRLLEDLRDLLSEVGSFELFPMLVGKKGPEVPGKLLCMESTYIFAY